MTNELTEIVQQSGLNQESKVQELMKSFTGYFKTAQELANGAKDIVVTDTTQIELMDQARVKRLELKKIRVEVENTRKELKEQSLREGRAIDGVANVIKALIVPVEEHLEKQEKFAELIEAKRQAEVLTERIEKLSKYVDDVSLYKLEDMETEVFDNLLAGCKANYEKAQKEQEEAEKQRLAQIEADRKEQERIRLENEKLRKEAEEKERLLEVERKKQADEIRKVNEAREKAEAKLRAEKEAQLQKERIVKEQQEALKRAEEEKQRQALLAPDKEKLIDFATNIDKLVAPSLSTNDAKTILDKTISDLLSISNYIREKAKGL